jgi:hypothetical protein
MARLIPLLVLAAFMLLVAALYDCVTSDQRDVRGITKVEWVLVIVLLPFVGAAMWFLRRPSAAEEAALAASKEAHPSGQDRALAPGRPRELAPDNDPEFLRRLGEDLARRAEARGDEERLRRWEAELRRREDRLREHNDDT